VIAVKLNSNSNSGFVDDDYGNILPIIRYNVTIELNSAAEENQKNGVWLKGFLL
jgi:hypothetical protein